MGHGLAHVRGGRLPAARLRARRWGYTLIELLIIIVILSLLATLVVAQFANAEDEAQAPAVNMQLARVRNQIEYYRSQHLSDPDLLGTQWDDMVTGNYLQQAPVNILNDSTLIAAAAGPGVGWVWRDPGTGVFDLFATDESGMAEWVE